MNSHKKSFFINQKTPTFSFSNGFQYKKWRIKDDKLILIKDGRKKIVTTWEFSDDALVQTFAVDNVIAKKYYQRADSTASAVYSWCEKCCGK